MLCGLALHRVRSAVRGEAGHVPGFAVFRIELAPRTVVRVAADASALPRVLPRTPPAHAFRDPPAAAG